MGTPVKKPRIGRPGPLMYDLKELTSDLQQPQVRRRSALISVENDDFLGDGTDENLEPARRPKSPEPLVQPSRPKSPQNAFGMLSNFTPAELEEHYAKCMSLCSQNKVNSKNAFQLQLIDYLSLITKTQPEKAENLSMMGFCLESSAKIFGHRVDKVYSDLMALLKKGKAPKPEESDSESEEDEEKEVEEENPVKKKKKVDHLLDFEKMLLSDLKSAESEEPFKHRATLPSEFEFFLECPFQGYLVTRAPLFPTVTPASGEECYIEVGSRFDEQDNALNVPDVLPSYNDLPKTFFVVGANLNEPPIDPDQMYCSDHQMLNNSFEDVETEDPQFLGDYDDFSDEEVAISNNCAIERPVETANPWSIKSLASMVSAKPSDYSFFDKGRLDFWPGPAHWSAKIRKNRANQDKGSQRVVAPRSKKWTRLDISVEAAKDLQKIYPKKSGTIRSQVDGWADGNRNVMGEIGCSTKSLLSLFSDESKTFFDFSPNHDQSLDNGSTRHSSFGGDDFLMDDHVDPELSGRSQLLEAGESIEAPSGLDLIEAPPMVNQVPIQYAKFQKKVDIKRMKQTMWSVMDLATSPLKENRNNRMDAASPQVKFSSVLEGIAKEVPSTENAETSVPVAFMCLLHLANEKTLKLAPDQDDITICLDNKN